MVPLILSVIIGLFPISELALAILKRSRGKSAQRGDRGSMQLLWLCITLGVVLAILARQVSWARIPGPMALVNVISLTLLLGGLTLRWISILTLGRLFTVDVAVYTDHEVVQTGLYRVMRHPSYTGLLIAFLGLGLAFTNYLSVLGLFLPIIPGMAYRVAKEEQALLSSLGPAYSAYCSRTKRFIPGLL